MGKHIKKEEKKEDESLNFIAVVFMCLWCYKMMILIYFALCVVALTRGDVTINGATQTQEAKLSVMETQQLFAERLADVPALKVMFPDGVTPEAELKFISYLASLSQSKSATILTFFTEAESEYHVLNLPLSHARRR